MKRKIAIIMLLVFVAVMFSGCKLMVSLTKEYWDGMTKLESREYIQDTLQEKYGEEFVVKKIFKTGANYYSSSDLLAYCSPKSDESIVFDIEVIVYGKEEKRKRYFHDGYIQSLVRQEMKNNIEGILSKYYDNYSLEIDVRGLSDLLEAHPISKENATIKNYTETIPETNSTWIWVVLKDEEIQAQDKLNKVINEMTMDFYSTKASIEFYYASDNVISECNKKIKEQFDRSGIDTTVSARYPFDGFFYKVEDGEKVLTQVDFANEETALSGD